jgi:hypothetical protein
VGNFDVIKCDDCEWLLGELDQAVSGGLTEDVGAVWDTIEAEFAERNIDVDVLALASIGDLLGEELELAIELGTTSTLLLLGLEFFLVTVSIFALSISGLIELDVGSFAIELDILLLLLTDHDWILEMNMDDDDQLVLTRLEKEMLDVAE